MKRILGWDIGGAHLKLAVVEDGCVVAARQVPCALWRGLEELRQAFSVALDGLGTSGRHAATMTGELADLFPDRAAGVAAILGELERIAPSGAIGVYGSDGGFLTTDAARQAPDRIASANWHATGAFAAGIIGNGVLVDIGSTTTDLIPFRDGRPAARGFTDHERLATGELVYTGIVRTPLMAIAREVPFAGRRVGVMAELFATASDAHRLAGTLPEGADVHPAADGRGKSLAESRARLARMIGMDAGDAPETAWEQLADWFVRAQLRQLEDGLENVLSHAAVPVDAPLVGAGIGRGLAAELARSFARPYLGLEIVLPGASEALADAACDIAPAASVALLLAERA